MLAPRQRQRHRRRDRFGMGLVARQQRLGLAEASLAIAELGEAAERERTVPGAALAAAVERQHELVLGARPVAHRGQHAAVDRAAPRVQRGVAAADGEPDDAAAPLRGALEVREPIAGHERRAAGVADRERSDASPVAAAIASSSSVIPASTSPRRRARARAGRARRPPGPRRPARAPAAPLPPRGASRSAGGRRALGELDLEPAALRTRSFVREQAPRARASRSPRRARRRCGALPPGRSRGSPPRACRPGGVECVGLAPLLDALVRIAEPPQRAAEAVEGVGVFGLLAEAGDERVARGRPVGALQRGPAVVGVGGWRHRARC